MAGFLWVGPYYGPLAHKGGYGFFWVGDAAWAAPMEANMAGNPSEWERYLINRESKQFSVVQIGLAPFWAGPSNRAGDRPFCSDDPGAGPCDVPTPTSPLPRSDTRPGLPFWRNVDAMVKAANDHQLVVFVNGLMRPVGGDPAQPFATPTDAQRYPPQAEAVIFARWLASRLSGSHVIFSPAADSPPITTSGLDLLPLMKAVGAEIKRVAPRHLVTNHWSSTSLLSSTNIGTCPNPTYSELGMDDLHPESWLDFHFFQSGTICDLSNVTQRARELAPQLNSLSVPPIRKVTVNGEATYDNGDVVNNTNRQNRFRARQTAWLSSLSGTFGFSTGIGGIHEWGLCGLPLPNPCPEQFPPGWRSYSEGMAQGASDDMTAFRRIRQMASWYYPFSNEQWRLTLNPSLPNSKKQAFLRDGYSILAYLPEGPSINIAPSGLTGDVNLRKWYDPRTATLDIGPAGFSWLNGVAVFNNPAANDLLGSGDRVLLQPARSVSAMGWAGTSEQFVQAFEGRYVPEDTWGIWGEVRDKDAILISGPVRISDPTVSEAHRPAVSRDGKGGFLVVWEADGNGDGLPEVRGRRLNQSGVPVNLEFEVSFGVGSHAQSPSVALDGDGNAVIAWESLDEDSGLKQVWIQRLDSADTPLGDPEAIGQPQDDWAAPRVASDADGNVFVVWAEADQSGGNALVSLFLGKSGQMTSQVVASSLTTEVLALSEVIATKSGRFVVEWEAIQADGSATRRAHDYSLQGNSLTGEYAVTSTLTGGEVP
jgi:hypothetical protein